MEPISHKVLHDLAGSMMDGHIKYDLGKKATFDAKPEDIKHIDCSGFVRYFLYHVTRETVQIPDGSWHQNEWCKNQGFAAVDYSTAAQDDDTLRLGYFPAVGKTSGHIWLILNGKTLESSGGKGPNRRAWDTKVLKDSVKHCYKLTQVVKENAALVFCFDMDRLLNFFRVCAWGRVEARLAYPRYKKADFGWLSPFASAGYFEIDMGDPAVATNLTSVERQILVDKFLAKASANIPQGIKYIEFLGEEAKANFDTLRDMLESARFSQAEFMDRVEAISSFLIRVQTTAELAMSVMALWVPVGGAIYLAEEIAVTFATTWSDGAQATALAVGGNGLDYYLDNQMEKRGLKNLEKIVAKKNLKSAQKAFKYLFVAKDFAEKLPVLINPKLVFDRY